jgi:hypothetical protein
LRQRPSKRRGSGPISASERRIRGNERRWQRDTHFDLGTTHASGQHRTQHFSAIVNMGAALVALFEKLSFPSALKFRRAAEVAGRTISVSDAKKFVSTYSQRQVTAPAQPHNGVITASQIDARWQADLASYVAQEATIRKIKYTHVLCVLDIFSRYMWTRKLRNGTAESMTKAFESILDSSGRQPIEMNIDRGKNHVR